MPKPKSNDRNATRGLNQNAIVDDEQGQLGETGGSAGGGTRAGQGDPSGGPTDPTISIDDAPASESGSIRDRSRDEIAEEAGVLGPADASLADAASRTKKAAQLSSGPVAGESVGSGAGRGEAASGPQQDRGELGGGGAPGQHGGSGSVGSDGGKRR